jgi:hypothetical protein
MTTAGNKLLFAGCSAFAAWCISWDKWPNSQARDDDSCGCDPNNGLRRLKWTNYNTSKALPPESLGFSSIKAPFTSIHFVQEAVAVHAALLRKTPECFQPASCLEQIDQSV